MSEAYLRNLNRAQLQAVQHPPDIPLQILAGPGSGKTRVLTSRIAHLIFHYRVAPQAICAVTFTNKAANEMRARLEGLVGVHETGRIRMGTFHALCASFLRRHGRLLNLETNFTICDADESKKIVKKLLEDHLRLLADKNISLTEGTVTSMISQAKARGETADDYQSRCLQRKSNGSRNRLHSRLHDEGDSDEGESQLLQDTTALAVIAEVYKDYECKLRESSSLDFDDLLLFGVRLFTTYPTVGEWCRHVLVDEFQDTNTIQYQLMRRIAAASGCVTIVGDPDQSIYGWRSAEVKNLKKMQRDFPKTQQILLEQNYRSTASILRASMAIVAQDKKRVAKALQATHPAGPRPVLQLHYNEHQEAAFIAGEIKRLVAATGGMLGWGDFVVLLRFNALSRLIESALQREGIPNRILGGHKFFERLEVKDLLAYLQLIDNPHFVPAFSRVINVPARGIGEKTIAEILSTAERLKLSPLDVVMRIYEGTLPDIKPNVKRKLATFVPPMQQLQKLAREVRCTVHLPNVDRF
ncbi:UvrD/REP type DNA helicase [Daedalea quercina L-15889]|uniref:DNA 3'-5' helicase n=1 Tax=Daedalea quercina L-15889 TaxID=1314783 RepID=A0A165TL51_9APHY|nr:UvrD/REP type DNA helicase [Daedalea quercina L-15889]